MMNSKFEIRNPKQGDMNCRMSLSLKYVIELGNAPQPPLRLRGGEGELVSCLFADKDIRISDFTLLEV